jgi:sensor domain CHASE-containing protein
MKKKLQMTKEDLKTEIRQQRETIEQLKGHCQMDQKTIDQMRLTLLTAAVFQEM